MSNSKLLSGVVGYCSIMGLYGFTRGYRCENRYTKVPMLMTERIFNGFIAGCVYSNPFLNFWQFKKLVNRIEISYYKLDKKDYTDCYDEICGICYDTI
jgi:hypothetical protein